MEQAWVNLRFITLSDRSQLHLHQIQTLKLSYCDRSQWLPARGLQRVVKGGGRKKKTRKTLWQRLDVRFVHNVDSVMDSWDEASQNIKLCILYTEIAKQQCCLDNLQRQSNFPHLYLFLYPHYSFPVFPILSSALQDTSEGRRSIWSTI